MVRSIDFEEEKECDCPKTHVSKLCPVHGLMAGKKEIPDPRIALRKAISIPQWEKEFPPRLHGRRSRK